MAVPEKAAGEQDDIFGLLTRRAEKRGDLPIFNASLNKVRHISSDPDSHAMELAQTIMKDVNLSVKLLRIANSPYYNRGLGKISSIARAVVLLGFDTIKNLCLTLKLIDSFQNDHPALGMQQMVARAYLTAGFVRDISLKCRIKEIEEAYICGLCHNLGDIAIAYFLPEQFNEIHALQKSGGLSWSQAQEKVLGTSMAKLGQHLATTWNFPVRVVSSMRPYNPAVEGAVRNRDQLTHAMVGLSSEAVGSLYTPQSGSGKPLRELFQSLSDATGIRVDALETSLSESFQMSCELAKEYGLNQRVLQPAVAETSDPFRDKFAREFAFISAAQLKPAEQSATPAAPKPASAAEQVVTQRVNNTDESSRTKSNAVLGTEKVQPAMSPAPTANGTVTEARPGATAAAPTAAGKGDPLVQLSIIQEITTLVTEAASLNKLFVKILEGLHRGVGFDRAALALVSPDRTNYVGRLALGENTEKLKLQLSGVMRERADIFARIMIEGGDLSIDDTADASWKDAIKKNFVAESGASAFVIAGIRSGHKPIGLFYADNSVSQMPITAEMRRGFLQFIAQARLAIQVRG